MVDTVKRVAWVALFVGGLMFVQPVTVFADQGSTRVICANAAGEQITRQIGWDNSNRFFEGKGDIPRLYCEGGFAGENTHAPPSGDRDGLEFNMKERICVGFGRGITIGGNGSIYR